MNSGTHLHQQKPRRDAKRHHVAQAVELRPEIARRPRQPRHVAIQRVEHHRQKDQPAAEHDVVRGVVFVEGSGRVRLRDADATGHDRQVDRRRRLDARGHHDAEEPANQVAQREQRRQNGDRANLASCEIWSY